MIKITYQDVLTMQEAVENMVKLILPAQSAWRFGVLAREIRGHLQTLENVRRDMVGEFGTKADGKIEVDKDKMWEFQEKWVKIVSEEIEIDFEPISVVELGNQEMSISDMAELSIFFVEDALVSPQVIEPVVIESPAEIGLSEIPELLSESL